MKRINKITVEKNIPIPKPLHRSIYQPARNMKVGDSFLIPSKSRFNMSSIFKRMGFKATTRAEGKDTHRVWRIK